MEYLHIGDMFVNKLGQDCYVVADMPSELKYLIYNKHADCIEYYSHTYLVVNNCSIYKYFVSDTPQVQRIANKVYKNRKVDFETKES